MPELVSRLDSEMHSRGMDRAGHLRVEELDSPLQRIVRRKRIFFVLPTAAIVLVAIIVGWEILRQNLPDNMTAQWPWKLKLLDLESGATMLTVLAVIVFTRAQYAEAMKPIIGWGLRHESVDQHRHPLKSRQPVLILVIYNSGGGAAVVQSIDYRFARNDDDIPSPWVSAEHFHEHMASAGLRNHKDYFFVLTRAPGYPLPPLMNSESAPLAGAIKVESILRFRIFDIRIRLRDQVGDIHERILPCRARVNYADMAALATNKRESVRSLIDRSLERARGGRRE